MHDIICFGSATEDVFIDTEFKEIVSKKRHFIGYPAGAKIVVKELRFSTGGGGTNTAVSFARLGFKTGYIGNLGMDFSAQKILDELKRENVDFLGSVSEGFSGFSVILDSAEHHRTVLTYKGANDNLEFSRIKNKLDTKWFYFSSLMHKSFETQKRIFEHASRQGARIAYNPSEYQVRKGYKNLKGLLKCTEVLILNKEEAKLLLGQRISKGGIAIETLAQKIGSLGPRVVCITDEDKGAYAYLQGNKLFYSLIPHKIKAVEKTGAGDAFASAFVAGIIRGRDIEFSLQLALANAESVIRHFGAKNKLLTWKGALDIIKKNPAKIKTKYL